MQTIFSITREEEVLDDAVLTREDMIEAEVANIELQEATSEANDLMTGLVNTDAIAASLDAHITREEAILADTEPSEALARTVMSSYHQALALLGENPGVNSVTTEAALNPEESIKLTIEAQTSLLKRIWEGIKRMIQKIGTSVKKLYAKAVLYFDKSIKTVNEMQKEIKEMKNPKVKEGDDGKLSDKDKKYLKGLLTPGLDLTDKKDLATRTFTMPSEKLISIAPVLEGDKVDKLSSINDGVKALGDAGKVLADDKGVKDFIDGLKGKGDTKATVVLGKQSRGTVAMVVTAYEKIGSPKAVYGTTKYFIATTDKADTYNAKGLPKDKVATIDEISSVLEAAKLLAGVVSKSGKNLVNIPDQIEKGLKLASQAADVQNEGSFNRAGAGIVSNVGRATIDIILGNISLYKGMIKGAQINIGKYEDKEDKKEDKKKDDDKK